MHKLRLVFTLIFVFHSLIQSQTLSSIVIDKKSGEPVPFATIQLTENEGVITNEEGRFSFIITDQYAKTDSIFISSMGYEKIGISAKKPLDSVIYISPKAIELNSVFVSNKNLTIEEIMDQVEERMGQNYSRDLTKKRLFFRQSDFNNLDKINIGFKKSTIKEFNKKFIDSVISIIPRKAAYYTEALCDYSGDFLQHKLNIIKGAELYDKTNDGSMEALSKKVETIMKENIKPTSYLKIKSGWFFGTKVQMDSIFENNEEAVAVKDEVSKPKNDKETSFVKYRKSTLKYLFSNLFFQRDSEVNFIQKLGRYNFELIDYTLMGEISTYVINFSPKRNADFKGTIYVNTQDFAIMRVDYQNVQRLKNFHLLGVHYQETMYKGTTIFTKGENGKYSLKYLEKTKGNNFEIDRPLKVIEMNKVVKGKNKQNELSLNLNFANASISKFEIVVFDEEQMSPAKFENSIENKTVKPQYLSKYDPQFWKGYNIIEPNTAIREFRASSSR